MQDPGLKYCKFEYFMRSLMAVNIVHQASSTLSAIVDVRS